MGRVYATTARATRAPQRGRALPRGGGRPTGACDRQSRALHACVAPGLRGSAHGAGQPARARGTPRALGDARLRTRWRAGRAGVRRGRAEGHQRRRRPRRGRPCAEARRGSPRGCLRHPARQPGRAPRGRRVLLVWTAELSDFGPVAAATMRALSALRQTSSCPAGSRLGLVTAGLLLRRAAEPRFTGQRNGAAISSRRPRAPSPERESASRCAAAGASGCARYTRRVALEGDLVDEGHLERGRPWPWPFQTGERAGGPSRRARAAHHPHSRAGRHPRAALRGCASNSWTSIRSTTIPPTARLIRPVA